MSGLTLEEALYRRMSTYAELTALVSTRIYPNTIPQDATLPAVSYQKISSTSFLTQSGPSGWARSTIQISIAANDTDDKKIISEAVRHCWNGYAGTLELSTAQAGITIGVARIDDRTDVDEGRIEQALGEAVTVILVHTEN